ncbi:MAG: hypothetical protein AAB211_10050, partial [Pseudomonadota bacterium]
MLQTNQGSPVTIARVSPRWPVLCFFLVLVLPVTFPVQAQLPDIGEASIRDLQLAMEKGELTAASLVAASLARIEAFDDQGPALNTK